MTKRWSAANILALGLLVLAGACTKISSMNRGVTSLNNPAYLTDNTFYTHVLKNVSLATLAGMGGATPDLELSLSVDVGRAGFTPLTSYCGASGSADKPCKCELSWTEVNTVGGNNTSVSRSKRLDIATVQSGLVKCQMTQSFWNEVATGTTVRMNIVQVAPNVSGLSVQSIGYKKGTVTTANGDFLDDTLTPFRNIHRYSCYSKRQSTFEIQNQFVQNSVDDGSGTGATITTTALIANKFCTGVNGGTTAGQCATLRSGTSAQSYYRNLYIRSDKLGEINSTNTYYDCPKVVESIRYSAGNSIPSAEKGKYWPLDSTFALATTYSSEWSVGVRAGTILYKAGDANSVSDGCTNEDTTKRLNERGIIIKCLGYAKPPLPAGTCGTLTDNNGRVRPMVRLRRFRAIYPTTYQANGAVEAGNTEADEVYVADRLVVDPAGVPTGAQIFGPKPCNFAWFDHEGVVHRDGTRPGADIFDFQSNMQASNADGLAAGKYWARPAYVSTTKYCKQDLLGNCVSSVNPDGLALPRFDRDGTPGGFTGPSCSAAIPMVEETLGAPSNVKLVTTHQSRIDSIAIGTRSLSLNEVHIKPVDPWSPNYVEDLSFRACVPVADPYLEPPMHFYNQDANTMGWCTMSYPTQNPYWVELNSRKKPLGATIQNQAVNYHVAPYNQSVASVKTWAPVQNYTSHDNAAAATNLDANNSCTSTGASDICLMSLGSTSAGDYATCSTYLAPVSGVRNTCDRTVTFDANQADRTFPLQAEDTDIDSMLKQDLLKDRTFSCQYSVNPDPTKIGARIPMSGCCGIVNGLPVLTNIMAGANRSGHLEPFLNPAVPNIRFCGNPVDLP
ncbi:MAG: hypothetical protein JST80_12290 [Bdellovibrionales bacterium]|nr:hypothetical protein [Bdellovibrionales bacterium]